MGADTPGVALPHANIPTPSDAQGHSDPASQWHEQLNDFIDLACQRGIKRIVSIDRADNVGMRHLAAHFDFEGKTGQGSHGEVLHRLAL